MGWFDEPGRRSLGIRDKQIVWERAAHKCESCSREITFTEMQVGHKTAYARGGSTNMKNSVCLCYACNRLQGTDSWATFQKKLGREVVAPSNNMSGKLESLSIAELKFLVNKHGLKPKAKVVEGLFSDTRVPPGKKQYIKALSSVVTDSDIEAAKANEAAKPVKKKKRRQSSSWW